VIVWGDEFYQDVESPDGYTLIRDSDGWICYAELSADGNEYVSTGVRYTSSSRAPGVRKGLRISRESVREKQRLGREDFGDNELIRERPRQRQRRSVPSPAPSDEVNSAPAEDEPERVVGLTILVEFPDERAGVTRAMVLDWLNRQGGVGGNTPGGSVYDYFYNVSDGLMEYSNIMPPIITMDHNKDYYDNVAISYGTNGRRLVADALSKLNGTGFDLSNLTTEGNVAVALNILYAGSPEWGWTMGLWPHRGRYNGDVTVNGINFSDYQVTSLGTGNTMPGTGVFVHENGHLLMEWPDLYSYTRDTEYVGRWCLMSSSQSPPLQPNAYYRYLAGWISTTDITNATDGTAFSHNANGPTAYVHRRNNQEAYFIEARRRIGPSNSVLPGSGLAIWHVHTEGLNTRPDSGFAMVRLIQADGRNDIENGTNRGDATDLFRLGVKTNFNSEGTPAAIYYDGISSEIGLVNISDSGAVMTFSIGGRIINAARPTITVQPVNSAAPIGGALTMSVSASVSDGGTLSYQWYSNTTASNSGGTAIDGATNSSYSVPTSIARVFNYYVVVTNTNNNANNNKITSVASNVATVAIYFTSAVPPVIAAQPISSTVSINEDLTLSVLASVSDGGALSYQWYSNTTASNSGGTAIDGATNSSYSVPAAVTGTFYYYVAVTNTNSSAPGAKIAIVTSDVATVVVYSQQAIDDFYAQIAAYATATADVIVEVEQDIALDRLVSIPANASGRTLSIRSANPNAPVTLMRGRSGNLFTILARATLILENIIIDGASNYNYGFEEGGGTLLNVNNGGTLVMNDGAVVHNNVVVGFAGGVYVRGGTFTMNGGKISGNTASRGGGGVCVLSGSKVIMAGGEISGNTADYGAGVYVYLEDFTMTGGKINSNTARYGGGVYVHSSTFTMTGGEIIGNTSTGTYDYGGGLYMSPDAIANLNGGVVAGASAAIRMGTATVSVVYGNYNLNIGASSAPNNGVIVTWSKPSDNGPFTYTPGTATDLIVLPLEKATATWATQGSEFGISYQSGTNTGFIEFTAIAAGAETSIRPSQAKTLNFEPQIRITGNTIILENVPQGAKVEVYNLSGKLICKATPHSQLPTPLKIEVQTTGIYIVKINNQTLRVAVR
jgi:M6 family metalloprotease-like protein